MKTKIANKHWIGALLIVCQFIYSMSLVSCAEDDRLDEITVSNTDKGSDQGGNQEVEQPDEVLQLLASIPGVKRVTKEVGANERFDNETIYFFYFEQLIDHSNPTTGTFLQHCCLHYVDANAPVVLYTCGYNMDNNLKEARLTDLAKQLKANTLEIEHRYFNQSLPEPFENLDFTYLWTDQAAADLHNIVSTVKQKMFSNQKWVSTGISKDGITTALYAYYSDKYGWNDVDLYVPFCAPFLTATPTNSDDIRIGEYLYNNCGRGYPATSTEGIAYERLRQIPVALLRNEGLRQACLRMFHQKFPDNYVEVINTFGRTEEQATCGMLEAFYDALFDKFSYVPFHQWAPMVPDVDQATATPQTFEDVINQSVALTNIATFVFMDSKAVKDSLERKDLELTDEDGEELLGTRGALDDEGLYALRQQELSMPYYVQAARQLGNVALDRSMIDGTYVSKAQVESVFKLFYNATRMQKYAGQWDGGVLMSSFRSWVQTQQKFPMIFVYCTNDPWTGGAIDDVTNPKVTKVLNPGGMHSDDILDRTIYTQESYDIIKQAIAKYIGL